MFKGTLEWFQRAIAGFISRLRLIVKLGLFRWRWGINLTLPPALHSDVEGQVLPWEEEWIEQLESAFTRLPRAVIKTAKVRYIFVVQDLRRIGLPHEGVAYEFTDKAEPKWIGLNVSLFIPRFPGTGHLYETELGVPLLYAILAEEIAHVWDYRLEDKRSPYSLAGAEWRRVEFDVERLFRRGLPS
ncbi:hypothetical protein HYR99_04330 [Candidatus Poribacteria bacterium]|nr:hypothetical protein [Candidatus Poribacteria bacterium]